MKMHSSLETILITRNNIPSALNEISTSGAQCFGDIVMIVSFPRLSPWEEEIEHEESCVVTSSKKQGDGEPVVVVETQTKMVKKKR